MAAADRRKRERDERTQPEGNARLRTGLQAAVLCAAGGIYKRISCQGRMQAAVAIHSFGVQILYGDVPFFCEKTTFFANRWKMRTGCKENGIYKSEILI